MVPRKKRIVLAVLLGVAVAALAVDRLLPEDSPFGPDKATASLVIQGDAELAEAEALSSQEFSPPPPPKRQRTLADHLESFAGSRGLDPLAVKDAFCAPQAWLGPQPALPQAALPDSDETRAQQFATQRKLTATAVGPDGGMAIIDGQCLLLGHGLDGFRLVSVDRGSATLVCNGVRVTLQLETDALVAP